MHSIGVLDGIPLLGIFLICMISMFGFIELGFRLGRHNPSKQAKAQMAQVRAIMGATLGLLAFMLAFSFSMAQQHFETRMQAYLLEINAIESTYRGTDLLDRTAGPVAKELLTRFVRLRIETRSAGEANQLADVADMLRESERLLDELWSIAVLSATSSESIDNSQLFTQSVLAMIDANDARLQAVLYNRISPVIWFTLFVMSLLSMIVMGYQAGLTGTRSTLATWSLALAFSTVMALVTDLDRPNMTLFSFDHHLMMGLEEQLTRSSMQPQVMDSQK
jgi:hypothetical protein